MKKILIIGIMVSQLFASNLDISKLPKLKVDTNTSVATSKQKMLNISNCYGCHGKDFGRKAMGKSKIVKDMDSKTVYTELKKYKDGQLNQYGMGMIMKGQLQKYSDTELKLISKNITKD